MIEKRLLRKLALFRQAVIEGGEKIFTASYPEAPIAFSDIAPNSWGKLEKEIGQNPFKFLKEKKDLQFQFLQSNRINIILAARSKEDVDTLILELKQTGYLPENIDYKGNVFLRSLGMVSLSLPPVQSLIVGLEQFKNIALIGDGDAVIKLDPYPVGDNFNPFDMGAFEAVVRTMGIDYESLQKYLLSLPVPVKIAVIDSGIDQAHPDLCRQVLAAQDFSAAHLGPVDSSGHGTHVAGILAGYNAKHPVYSGVAPTARLLDAQIMEPQGICTIYSMLNGIGWALETGADILNMSFGRLPSPEEENLLEWQAINAASRLGVLTCAAAGNEALKVKGPCISHISACPSAICVAAIDAKFLRAPFSNYGPAYTEDISGLKPNLAAPGLGIVSTRSRASSIPPWKGSPLYASLDGTSMATPIISGLLAMAMGWARARQLPLESSVLKEKLYESCVHPDGKPDYQLGLGVPHLGRFFESLEQLTKRPVSISAGHNITKMNVVVNQEPPLVKIPNLRRQEQEIFAYWKNRIENRITVGHESLAFRKPVTLTWTTIHHETRLKDLKLIHHLSEDHFNRLPWMLRTEGTLSRNGNIEGRVICQYIADIKSLCTNRIQQESWESLQGLAGKEWQKHRERYGTTIPLFLAFAGCIETSNVSFIPESNIFAAVSLDERDCKYYGPSRWDAWRVLFYPKSDTECCNILEKYLAHNLVGACLAETVARDLDWPLPMVLALGKEMKNFQLEYRKNSYVFFQKAS